MHNLNGLFLEFNEENNIKTDKNLKEYNNIPCFFFDKSRNKISKI